MLLCDNTATSLQKRGALWVLVSYIMKNNKQKF